MTYTTLPAINNTRTTLDSVLSLHDLRDKLEEQTEIPYPISYSQSRVIEGGKRYCSKRVRHFLAMVLFGKTNLTDIKWRKIRKLAVIAMTGKLITKGDKTKVLNQHQLHSLFFTAVFVKVRN